MDDTARMLKRRRERENKAIRMDPVWGPILKTYHFRMQLAQAAGQKRKFTELKESTERLYRFIKSDPNQAWRYDRGQRRIQEVERHKDAGTYDDRYAGPV